MDNEPNSDASPGIPPPGQVLEIRKYPNRRLYDATRSQHVTLDELFELVAAGHTIKVSDSKTGEDLTNQILLQALIERDPLKVNAVPTPMIHMMIRMNAQIIASFFDMGLSQMFNAYRAAAAPPTGAAGAPWWPAGWPAPGVAGQPAGVPWTNPFAQAAAPQGVGVPANPMEWLQSFMGKVPGTPASTPTPEPPPGPDPVEAADATDLDALQSQVAALAAELERMRSGKDAKGDH